MEVENKELFLDFDKIDDVPLEKSDEIITEGLYLNDALSENNLSVVDDLLIDIMDKLKEDDE